MQSPSRDWPEDVCSVVAVEAVDAAAGWLRHEAVVPGEGEVGAVDVQRGLEEHGPGGLQVRGARPEPDTRGNYYCSTQKYFS